MTSLLLDGITAGYGEFNVLRDVTIGVPDGAVVALLGANGAGKTTLLRVASGLLPAARGRVVVDGNDCTNSRPEALVAKGICHVPEGRGIFPSLTVEESLRLYSDCAADPNALDAALDALPRLRERLDQPAGTMSGGEQQMLALARTYIQRPGLVLLDEVSMGLAPNIVDEIFTFLRRLAGEGVGMLLVEQYVEKALEIADFVFVMQRGRVVFAGEAGEVQSENVLASYLGSSAPVGA